MRLKPSVYWLNQEVLTVYLNDKQTVMVEGQNVQLQDLLRQKAKSKSLKKY